VSNIQNPKVFLCHSIDDHVLVLRLGKDLRSNGVDVWLDEWEIKPGDSLRRKIDEGLGNADYFFAILTRNSLGSEWVATELDSGLVLKISGQCRIVPIPIGISDNEIPLTLRGLVYVRLDNYDEGLRKLIGLCHGVSEKPRLGDVPEWVQRTAKLASLDLSPHAEKLAVLLNKKSENGLEWDPRLFCDDIKDHLEITDDEIAMAASELEDRGWAHLSKSLNMGPAGFHTISPLPLLFIETDQYVKDWNPEEDAVTLACALLNTGQPIVNVKEVDETLGWGPRRINPAIYFLDLEGAIGHSEVLDPVYAYDAVIITARTKRYVLANQ